MKLKNLVSGVICAFSCLIFTPKAQAVNCNLDFLAQGMPADEYISYMSAICNFLEKANRKLQEATGNPNAKVNVLSSSHLLTFYSEGIDTVMVAGRSAHFKPEEAQLLRNIRSEIASGLTRFNKEKTVFFPGGTASGTVGVFHEMAVHRGFRVVGVTSLAALKEEPALMTDIYFELGAKFGAESNTAVKQAKSMLVLGGGRQTAREAIKLAFAEKKPLYIVNNPTFAGKSQEIADALSNNDKVMVFQSFAAAAAEMNRIQSEILPLLPNGSHDASLADIKEIYKDMTLAGFSTWSKIADAKDQERFKQLVTEMLDQMDKSKVAIVVSGTVLGGEGFVMREALKRGFDVIATPVESVKREQLIDGVTKYVMSGKKWETRDKVFIHLVDVLIAAGTSTTILKHIESAYEEKKPVFQLKNMSNAIDGFVNNLDPNILVDVNDTQRILEALNAINIIKKGCDGALGN